MSLSQPSHVNEVDSLKKLLDNYQYATVTEKVFQSLTLDEALLILNARGWEDHEFAALALCLRKHAKMPPENFHEPTWAEPGWAEDITFAAEVMRECKFLSDSKHFKERIPILLHVYAIARLLRAARYTHSDNLKQLFQGYKAPDSQETMRRIWKIFGDEDMGRPPIKGSRTFGPIMHRTKPAIANGSKVPAMIEGGDVNNNDYSGNANMKDETGSVWHKISPPRTQETPAQPAQNLAARPVKIRRLSQSIKGLYGPDDFDTFGGKTATSSPVQKKHDSSSSKPKTRPLTLSSQRRTSRSPKSRQSVVASPPRKNPITLSPTSFKAFFEPTECSGDLLGDFCSGNK
ncbi:hypothetical protein F4805DRAFT_406881 [Annulohypoxylon moriforme]|nr:hypothetical protein F4805DRAFT_406881 [Annulohypoxylon moriforme]